MKVHFWGVRGSLPIPGARTERYGGNTSCVEVRAGDGTRVIIDAGTGIRKLGKEMMRGNFEDGKGAAHLLLSHTHWDHIQGLPFFGPLYRKGNRLYIYARQRDDVHLRAVFASQTEDPYFPIPFDEAKAEISFRELADSAQFEINEFRITTTRLNHPYIATAYRLEADGASIVYASDTAPFSDILFESRFIDQPPSPEAALPKVQQDKLRVMRAALVRLCEGADLIVYDTMFTADDYRKMPHFGHSRPADALEICREAGARQLALFHHAPERADAEMDEILAETRAAAADGLFVLAAYEGLTVSLGQQT